VLRGPQVRAETPPTRLTTMAVKIVLPIPCRSDLRSPGHRPPDVKGAMDALVTRIAHGMTEYSADCNWYVLTPMDVPPCATQRACWNSEVSKRSGYLANRFTSERPAPRVCSKGERSRFFAVPSVYDHRVGIDQAFKNDSPLRINWHLPLLVAAEYTATLSG
jgi:hypothetical protein